jgi:hypothetical protein
MRAWEGVSPLDRTVESGIAVGVRRPKPLIPLRTALDSVNSSSRTSLSLIPAVLMLTRIASARKGVRITSITTDVTFLVVLAFIRFCLLDQLMRCVLLRDEHHVYNQCASGPTEVFGDSCGSLSPAVDKCGWPSGVTMRLSGPSTLRFINHSALSPAVDNLHRECDNQKNCHKETQKHKKLIEWAIYLLDCAYCASLWRTAFVILCG